MIDAVYLLVWPRSLFVWEARLVLQAFGSENWIEKVAHLLREAFQDPEVADTFEARFAPPAKGWGVASGEVEDEARTWLIELLAAGSRLEQYKEPVYWAERNSARGAAPGDHLDFTFPRAFVDLIHTFGATGYFPKILPVVCVDDYSDQPDVSLALRRATKLDIPWPMTDDEADSLPEPTLYSLIEYFHDQAARPRRAWSHNFNECGLHYEDFNSRSGHIVYRWKLNELLKTHGVPLRLGSSGEEQGRLIRHFNSPLDDLAAAEVTKRSSTPQDEVAHAIRLFRGRDATVAAKRAAIVMLYGEMEPRRKAIERKISSGDESDLFRIANQFNIRHRDKAQRTDYGEEFLDWVFWTNLATIRLLDDISNRQTPPSDKTTEKS
ncbi:hypothetical protein [Paenarthrobacter nicotinovorans]|uniref:hypothetical protein n=1 Tax=Paenarthrobacter nicotinovorans TaxID=29320 RepID=UPI003DA5E9D3